MVQGPYRIVLGPGKVLEKSLFWFGRGLWGPCTMIYHGSAVGGLKTAITYVCDRSRCGAEDKRAKVVSSSPPSGGPFHRCFDTWAPQLGQTVWLTPGFFGIGVVGVWEVPNMKGWISARIGCEWTTCKKLRLLYCVCRQ